MAKQYALSAMKRERAGKGVARALRRDKQTPAVIYGDNKSPVTISVPTKEVNLEYNKAHMFTMLCELEVDGEKTVVLARDVQIHPVTDNVLHVDFLRVNKKTKLTVAVPISFINHEECAGLKAKGNLNAIRFEVDLVCSAMAIPEEIVVDLTKFEIGDSIKISNAAMPEGAKPAIDDRDFTLATIVAPRVAEEEPTAAAAESEEGAEGEKAEGEEGEKAEGDAKPEEGKK